MRTLAAVLVWITAATALAIDVAGPTHGGSEVACDLPVSQRLKNIGGSDGSGLCVFTSITHSARYQNVDELKDFQKYMSKFPGGGYPKKVDKMIASKAKADGSPAPDYVQYEGKDLNVLKAALASGRMPAVTYDGRDPHYRSHIQHMVNLVYLDDKQACVLDNNFIGADQLVWMTPDEFLSRWIGGKGRQGWAVILTGPGTPQLNGGK